MTIARVILVLKYHQIHLVNGTSMLHVRTIPCDDSKDIHRRWCKNSTHPGHPVEMEQGARRVQDTRDGNTPHSRWPVEIGRFSAHGVSCVCALPAMKITHARSRVYSVWRCLNRIKKARAKGHRNCRHSQVCASRYTGVFEKENKFEINRRHGLVSLVVVVVCAFVCENVKRGNRIAFQGLFELFTIIET